MKTRILGVLCFFAFLGCGGPKSGSQTKSLTDESYTGKKYYFGWGEYLYGSMGNETRYDVTHTHNVFTKKVGGDYIGSTLINKPFGREEIKDTWSRIKAAMTPGDMYVQYSSGHGYYEGLAVGVRYEEMRDYVLSLPTKEAVVFMMSCHAGGLVDAFNRKKSEWQAWKDAGRTLFVMGSSRTEEESSTGPGQDRDEPQGPYGSAGSAFGHALWKALIGYADGASTGTKRGYMTLKDIITYTVRKTREIGGHTPVYTGVYDPELVIAKVPTRDQVEQILADSPERDRILAELTQDGIIQ